MRATSGCRTTSTSVKCDMAMPGTPEFDDVARAAAALALATFRHLLGERLRLLRGWIGGADVDQ